MIKPENPLSKRNSRNEICNNSNYLQKTKYFSNITCNNNFFTVNYNKHKEDNNYLLNGPNISNNRKDEK